MVVCQELPNKDGSSVAYSAHQVAAEVIRYHEQPVVPVWIGNYLKEATEGNSAGLELVAFSSYTIRERAPLPRGGKNDRRRADLEFSRPGEGRGAARG